jgi:c-di-GMP-binding flagellar brake protein YcgR
MIAMLRQLREHNVLVNAYYDNNNGCAVTALLAVNPDFEEVVFDLPNEALATRRLLAAKGITFVAFVESIKLQFTVESASTTQFDGKPALRVRLPEQMLRLQRRDYFRVRTPIAKPAHCLVPHGDDGQRYEKLRLLDISVGGCALQASAERFALKNGQDLHGCILDLPGIGGVNVGIKVRHVEPIPRDPQQLRAGCEFFDIAPQARMMLQRYVNKLDAEQRKAAGARAA